MDSDQAEEAASGPAIPRVEAPEQFFQLPLGLRPASLSPLVIAAFLAALAFISSMILLAILSPSFYDEDLAKNLIAEAVGAVLFAAIVNWVIRRREDSLWEHAEELMGTQVSHWVARIFMNTGLVAPSVNGRRPVEFVQKEERVGYSLPPDLDFKELAEVVLRGFDELRTAPDEEYANSILRAEKYLGAIEEEFGANIWELLRGRLEVDLNRLRALTSSFNVMLVTRHKRLFHRLIELDEISSFVPAQMMPEHLASGTFYSVLERATLVTEELESMGYALRLRVASL